MKSLVHWIPLRIIRICSENTQPQCYPTLKRIARQNRPDSQSKWHWNVSRLKFLYQQYCGCLLFNVSRNNRFVINLKSTKDAWYQDYLIYNKMTLYMSEPSHPAISQEMTVFERKLCLFLVKEAWIKLQKYFWLCHFNGNPLRKDRFTNA